MTDHIKPQPTADRLTAAFERYDSSWKPSQVEEFLCRELDDVRQQLARAQAQLAMMGLPEPPAEGVHVHRKVLSRTVMPTFPAKRNWICAECFEEGTDTEALVKGPTYEDLVAKKRSGE